MVSTENLILKDILTPDACRGKWWSLVLLELLNSVN